MVGAKPAKTKIPAVNMLTTRQHVVHLGTLHFPRTDNCGKLDRWQRLTELMCSAKRSFKRKSSSAGMLSSQSVCRVRYLVATVLMKCTATDPPVLRTT